MQFYDHKIIKVLALFSLALFLVQCPDRVVTTDDYEVFDIRRPNIIHTRPVDEAIVDNLHPDIQIWFDELIDESTVPGSFSFLPEVSFEDINALVYDTGVNGRIYASSENYGIFISDDKGANWSWVSRNNLRHGVEGFKMDSDKNRLWAFYENKLLLSTDDGVSFNPIELDLPNDEINVLEFPPDNSDKLYLGTHAGNIYISEDAGNSWQKSSAGLPGNPIYDIAICPENPQLIFVNSTENYIFKSDDGGINWNRHRAGLPFRDFSAIVFHPEYGNILYAGSISSGLVVSHDYGESWTNISAQLPLKKISEIYLSQNDTSTVYVLAQNKLYKSSDEGSNWQDLTEKINSENVDCFAIQNENLIIGNENGVYTSASGDEAFNYSNTLNMDELEVPGVFSFETWNDTITIISMIDSTEYDTTEITPFIEPRALENWKPGTEPPVNIHPDATMAGFQIEDGYTLFPGWQYQITLFGRFEDDLETLKEVSPVKDISENSMEVDFNLIFYTQNIEE